MASGHSSVALAYVAMDDMHVINQIIVNTERELGISVFHWAKQSWVVRRKFFQRMSSASFEVQAAILLNPFTETKFEEILEYLLIPKGIKQVIIDGKKPKRFASRLKKVLRDKGVTVKKLRTANDEAFPGLRLADAFAGLIRTKWTEPNNKKVAEIYKIVSNKITAQLVGGQAVS